MKEENKISEDLYTDIDFDDEDSDELRNTEFIDIEPSKIELKDSGKEKISKFYNENNDVIAAKVIEKKTGSVMEIKYNEAGKKASVNIKDKNKKLRKNTEYYENEMPRLMTDYALDGSYKSVLFNVDGSRQSYVIKHSDGTADAVYYNADGKGGNLIMKLDANKNVLEKRIEK